MDAKSRLQNPLSRPQAGRHIRELDGLRGIAVVLVLIYHFFNYSMLHKSWTGVAYSISRITEHGARGVDLFFVLSGFLITGILLDGRENPHFFKDFYARRALRILPVYYSVLLVILLCYAHSGSYVVLSFFYLSNIAPVLGIPMINGAMWSLSVEEHFYLFWPLLVHWLRFRTIVVVAAGICVAEPIIRGIAFHHVSSVFGYTWFRLDGLASGALIACFLRSPQYSMENAKSLVRLLLIAGVFLEIAGTPFGIRQPLTLAGAIGEYPAFNILFSAVVLWCASMAGSAQTQLLRVFPLRVFGDLSYCLYLIHIMVMDAYDSGLRAWHLSPAAAGFTGIAIRAAVVFVVCMGIASLSRKILEQPFLRLKRFFEPPVVERAHAAAAGRRGI